MTRLTRLDVLTSSLFLGCAIGSLFVADLVVARSLSESDLADWAVSKAIIFVGAGFCLMGVDQAVLRTDIKLSVVRRGLLTQVMVLGPVLAVSASVIAGLREGLVASIGAVALAVMAGLSAYNRSRFRITAAHLTLHGWKFAFLVAVIARQGVPSVGVPETATALLLSCAVLAYLGLRPHTEPPEMASAEYGELLPIARRFWVGALVASGMQYLDQILLTVAGERAASAEFFRYSVVFLSASTFAIAIVGQLANPWVRQNVDQIRGLAKKLLLVWAIASAVLAISSILAGLVLNHLLDLVPSVEPVLVLLLGLLAFVRIWYLYPSAIVGILADRRQLGLALAGTTLSLALFGASFVLLLLLRLDPLLAIAIAALASSVGRLSASALIAAQVIRSDRELRLSL